MEARREPSAPFAFPHHVGPGTRDLTSALLFHGRLRVTLPGWLTAGVLETFQRVGSHAAATQHELSRAFNFAAHFFELTQKHAISGIASLQPLGSRVERVLAVYPGDSAAYAKWDPLRETCLPIAMALLNEPLHSCTASVEFIWRVWETALELGADANNVSTVRPDNVLRVLKSRSDELGGDPLLLIAESGLNRYCMPSSGAGSYVTASSSSVGLLAAIGAHVREDITEEDPAVRQEALSFFLFDQVAGGFVKPLTPDTARLIAELMDEHADALARMRFACEREALALSTTAPLDERLLRVAIDHSLKSMEEEAQAIANVDRKTLKAYLTTLSENPSVWGTVAGLAASAIALPQVVTASLALTAFSLMGANAAKASRERREALSKSSWAFLYHAKKLLK